MQRSLCYEPQDCDHYVKCGVKRNRPSTSPPLKLHLEVLPGSVMGNEVA